MSNLIVPSLVLKCREMVAIKRMLWKELKSSWKSTTGLNRLVEQLMNMEGSANSDVTNSTATIEGKGETSLVSELGLIDPIVVNLLRKNTKNNTNNNRDNKKEKQNKQNRNNNTSNRARRKRPRFRTIVLVVLCSIRLARGCPNNTNATIWNERMSSQSGSCWYVVGGIGRMRMSSSLLANSIRQDKIHQTFNSTTASTSTTTTTTATSSTSSTSPTSPVRVKEDVSKSLSSLVSLFSTPSVGGYVTESNETQAPHNNNDHNHHHPGHRHHPNRTNINSNVATTSEILNALVAKDGHEVNDDGRRATDETYQQILIQRAMHKMWTGYIATAQNAKETKELLEKTANVLQISVNKGKGIEKQNQSLQHRNQALEERLRTFVVEECDIVESQDSVLNIASTISTKTVRNGLGDAMQSPLLDTSNINDGRSKFIRLSTSLYNDIRRERDRWKESYTALKTESDDNMETAGTNIVSLTTRLDSVTQELHLCTRNISTSEIKYEKKLKKLRLQGRVVENELRDTNSSMNQIALEMESKGLLLSKESARREELSTEITNLRIESRKSLNKFKERQGLLINKNEQTTKIYLEKFSKFTKLIESLENKLQWCLTREENKRNAWLLERVKLESEIERGRERERILVVREKERVTNVVGSSQSRKIKNKGRKEKKEKKEREERKERSKQTKLFESRHMAIDSIGRVRSKEETYKEDNKEMLQETEEVEDSKNDNRNENNEDGEENDETNTFSNHLSLSMASKVKMMATEKALLARVDVAIRSSEESADDGDDGDDGDGGDKNEIDEHAIDEYETNEDAEDYLREQIWRQVEQEMEMKKSSSSIAVGSKKKKTFMKKKKKKKVSIGSRSHEVPASHTRYKKKKSGSSKSKKMGTRKIKRMTRPFTRPIKSTLPPPPPEVVLNVTLQNEDTTFGNKMNTFGKDNNVIEAQLEDDNEDVALQGLTEMKAYIDRIDRRLFDRYGTPPRSKKF